MRLLLVSIVLSTLSYFALSEELNSADCTKNETQFLWRITSDRLQVPSYLFGTIHVSYRQIWNQVPTVVKKVFNNTKNVVFELELQKEETFRRLAKCKNLPNMERIHQHIPRELYGRLRKYLRGFREYVVQWFARHSSNRLMAKENAKRFYKSIVDSWDRKKPIWILFMLYRLEHPFEDMDSVPMLDVHLAHLSRRGGKRVFALESPEEQCDPLYSVSDSEVQFAINYTLSYLESIREERLLTLRHVKKPNYKMTTTLRLIEGYKCGSLEATLADPSSARHALGFGVSADDDRRAKEIDMKLRDDIISKRNVRMAERIRSFLEKNTLQSFFFAVGTGHFFGNSSIIELLQNEGYTVSEILRSHSELNMLEFPETKKFNSLWVRMATEEPNGQLETSSTKRTSHAILLLAVVYIWSFM
uniref:Metalloprotease TIKI homolog n=1 Tax=Steinernema glaseri TaxID=37863 RepID=A0A1I7Z3V7_9BILA